MKSLYLNGGAIVDKGKVYSEEEFKEVADKIKNIYNEGAIIIIIDDKSAQTAISIVSSMIADMDIIILDERYAKKTLDQLIEKYKIDGVMGSRKTLQSNSDIVNTIGYGIHHMRLSWEKEYKANRKPIVLLNTSGSSSDSKFVALTQKNIESNTISIGKYLNPSKNTRTINNLPLSYSYGLSVLNTTLAAGGMYNIARETSYLRQEFWDSCKQYCITDFSGVPRTYSDIIDLELITYMPSSLCQITQAGGRLSTKYQEILLEYSRSNEIKLFIMYGQTEASARLTYLELTKNADKMGSVGKPIPGVTLVSQNENANSESELIFKGQNISMGYIKNLTELKEKKDQNKGILKTGDIGVSDQEGFIYIKGRKSRLCKINGKRISLDSIEYSLSNVNIETVCISNDIKITVLCHGKHDEEVCKKIKQTIKSTTDIPKATVEVVMEANIVYTDSGKIAYGKLEELYYAN
tara:strand:- start:13219 stop:14613 length:1395 start_codon:yes stop_codon:yes gene_type:complete